MQIRPAHAAVAVVLAITASAAPAGAKPGGGVTTGSGLVFKVNPVQSSGDQSLVDAKDSASAVPAGEYATVPLRNLDGSGYLRGRWVTVDSATGTPAYSASGVFNYNRKDDQFEQVMAYFWVNQAQEYIQSLGFGSTLRPVVKQSFSVKIDQYGGDNELPDRQALPDPSGQGRGRRRRGRRGDRARVRPRRPRLPGAGLRQARWTPARSARPGVTTSPSRSASTRRSSTAGRSRRPRRASWTGTPRRTPPVRCTACAVSTPT
ncbi:hypothetical protein [Nocardioides convexus]|uniref:hypothetical protein n=1 Tax=Nocardioides convexus TaxID=2712224 RepID=UPI002418735F|nr:hypothetical protein [Nocardioides convexus]